MPATKRKPVAPPAPVIDSEGRIAVDAATDQLIEHLVEVNAAKSQLEREAHADKSQLVTLNGTPTPGASIRLAGSKHNATLFKTDDQYGPDEMMKARIADLVAEHLTPQYVTAHTVVTKRGYVGLTITDR